MNMIKRIMVSQASDSYLTLDPSVLKDKRQSGRSVTDAGGVPVFTDDFRQRMKKYEDLHQDGAIWEQIFIEKMNHQSNDAELAVLLFQSPMTEIRVESQAVEGNTPGILQGAMFAAICIGFTVFIYQYQKRRRGHHETNGRY